MRTDFTLLMIPVVFCFLTLLVMNQLAILGYSAMIAIITGAVSAVLLQTLGSIKIFGSGIDIQWWTIKLTFILVTLGAFWESWIALGYGALSSFPSPWNFILIMLMSISYVFGMFLFAVGGGEAST